MRDCHGNLNEWQTGFSLTHDSLLLTQPPTSPQSSSPICVREDIYVVPASGRGCRDCWKSVFCLLSSEHLIELVHDIFDRGFVRELVDHYGYHVSEGVCVKIISESCPAREKTCSTLASAARWHSVCLKTTKCKGNIVCLKTTKCKGNKRPVSIFR